MPGLRKLLPMRLSLPMPSATFAISAPTASQASGVCRLENRPVDFFHHCNGPRRFSTYDNAIRMKEVSDGGAFTKEFRVGDDIKINAIAIVD